MLIVLGQALWIIAQDHWLQYRIDIVFNVPHPYVVAVSAHTTKLFRERVLVFDALMISVPNVVSVVAG
jgi:hypothetical protein